MAVSFFLTACGTQEEEHDPIVDNPNIAPEVVQQQLDALDTVDWSNNYDGDDRQQFEKRTLANATEAREAMPDNTKKTLLPKQKRFKASNFSGVVTYSQLAVPLDR